MTLSLIPNGVYTIFYHFISICLKVYYWLLKCIKLQGSYFTLWFEISFLLVSQKKLVLKRNFEKEAQEEQNAMEGLIRVAKCMESGISNNRTFIILYTVLKW